MASKMPGGATNGPDERRDSPSTLDSYSAAVRAGGQVAELQAMVDGLPTAGPEVVLDVVFHHTAEGNHLGPTLCHRGLDNPAYYRLDPTDLRHYVDTTGCGNSLNAGDPSRGTLAKPTVTTWTSSRHCGARGTAATAT